MLENYSKTITSYAGTDIVCSINVPNRGPVIFGELSQISYSVYREKVPVRALGRVSMKGYTRGMRTITGILGFTVFDESIVYKCMEEIKKAGYRMLMDEMPTFDVTISMANEFGSRSKMSIYGISTFTEGTIMSVNDVMTQNVYEFYALDIDPIQRTNEEFLGPMAASPNRPTPTPPPTIDLSGVGSNTTPGGHDYSSSEGSFGGNTTPGGHDYSGSGGSF